MPAITIKNIPEDLYELIKKSAQQNVRSVNGEIIYRLKQALEHRRLDPDFMNCQIEELRRNLVLPRLSDELIIKAKNEGRR